jgi:hypothetical protein
VPSTGERGFEPHFYYFLCDRFVRLRPAWNQDIGIFVFPAGSRAIEIDHQCGTNPGKLISGNGYADTARADQNSQLGLTLGNTQRDFAAKIWIVDRFAPLVPKSLTSAPRERRKPIK